MSLDDLQSQAFLDEAYELLAELETGLLELEASPDDRDLINRIFRAMHTIKGSGAMFGFDEVADFTHEVETVFDQVRNEELEVTPTLLNLTFSARDHIKSMLDSHLAGEEADSREAERILDGLRVLSEGGESEAQEPEAQEPEIQEPEPQESVQEEQVPEEPLQGPAESGDDEPEAGIDSTLESVPGAPLDLDIPATEASPEDEPSAADGGVFEDAGDAAGDTGDVSFDLPPEEKPSAESGEEASEIADTLPELEPDEESEELSFPQIYRIRIIPKERVSEASDNLKSVFEELERLGEMRIVAHEEKDEQGKWFWWDAVLKTTKDKNGVEDVFFFSDQELKVTVDILDVPDDEDYTPKKIGEILLEKGDVDPEKLTEVLKGQKRIGELLAETGVTTPTKVEAALEEQKAVNEIRHARKSASHKKSAPKKDAPKKAPSGKTEVASSIRVGADKLDYLVDLVGELVIVQAQISQMVGERNDPQLTSLAEELERLSDELRDSTLGIRMLPIGTTFSKYRRLVRDLSAELGKEIKLETRGAETELDKTVIERLSDPLVHLIRNSVDHGVEKPDVRREAGKPAHGTITLSAEHSGGEVLIQIHDDGKGMDAKALFAKGVERGIISPDADLSEKECYNLIFQPGFSMAAEITSVSGRGVGMDVVKRSIDSLRGSIDITSTLGQGSLITIKLPLTLAIIDGLQVMVGEEYYVIPLSLVEECVELVHKEMKDNVQDQQIINLRGEIVPYIQLREWFEIGGETPPIQQIVITGVEGSRVGIVVDNVIGEHQTVIKTLGRVYRDVEGISGATIKGDGTMALILDVPRLVRVVTSEKFLD